MFAVFLRERREKVGLSQESLAKNLNLTKQAVQNWERVSDRHYPKYENLYALALALKTTPETLFSEILLDFRKPEILTVIEENANDIQNSAYPDTYPLLDCRWNPLLKVDPFAFAEKISQMVENDNSPHLAIAYAIIVLQRLNDEKGSEGQYCTIVQLIRLLKNFYGQGRYFVQKFSKIRSATFDEAKENTEVVGYFLNRYFSEKSSDYERFISSREFFLLEKVCTNLVLKEVLNPDIGKGETSHFPDLRVLYTVPQGANAAWIQNIINEFAEIPTQTNIRSLGMNGGTTMPDYPDWVEERFGDDIPEWAEERWGENSDDTDNK